MRVKVTDELGMVVFDLNETPSHEMKEKILQSKKPNQYALISCLKLNNSDFEFVNNDYYLLKDIFDYLILSQKHLNKELDISISFYNTIEEAIESQLLMHNQF
jgi:hypothetical protein